MEPTLPNGAPETSSGPVDPMSLDWGGVTLDLASDREKHSYHVCSHDLSSREAVDRSIRFMLARVRWAQRQVPPGWTHTITYDLRGQELGPEKLTQVMEELRFRLSPVAAVEFTMERSG